jgi:hypothetical protein
VPQAQPEAETVLQPQVAPEPVAEPATTEEATSDGAGQQKRKKDDRLNPSKILKGFLK